MKGTEQASSCAEGALDAVVSPEAADVVSTPTDDMFESAQEMEPKEFARLFNRRAKSHKGFSGSIPGADKT